MVSKAGVEALTFNTAREVGSFNIRCNVISPGAINNDRYNFIISRVAAEKGISIEEMEKEALKYIAMRCKIEPEELADTVLFLASDKAPHITGQNIEVSGLSEWEE